MRMKKPDNPYKKGSIIWSIMEGDWEDLTAEQIGEVLLVQKENIIRQISKIKKDTGYVVPRKKR